MTSLPAIPVNRVAPLLAHRENRAAQLDRARAKSEVQVATDLASPRATQPLVTVIILEFRGETWLERCLASLRAQTLTQPIEVLIADNACSDQSRAKVVELIQGWPEARFVQFGHNMGYSAGNNHAANLADGRYLFFLNNDTWLEADCLERMLDEAQATGAAAASPLVLDYNTEVVQSAGAAGFDIFGLLSRAKQHSRRCEIFVGSGCGLLVETEWFRKVGGFDSEFFMYGDEHDLCWRLWLAGGKVIMTPSARLHHRGAAAVNPRGSEEIVESRTSDTKRFYANRNNLMLLLKNSSSLLLTLVLSQMVLLAAEAAVMTIRARRWSHLKRSYLDAIWDCWRLRSHILAERRRLRRIRKHGDLWMLRFPRWRLNRWEEIQRLHRFGLPKVDAK
jgi:GT2 family glycosyltransferase